MTNNFKQTPSQFRNKPEWQPWHEKYDLIKYKGNNIMQVKIVDFKKNKNCCVRTSRRP